MLSKPMPSRRGGRPKRCLRIAPLPWDQARQARRSTSWTWQKMMIAGQGLNRESYEVLIWFAGLLLCITHPTLQHRPSEWTVASGSSLSHQAIMTTLVIPGDVVGSLDAMKPGPGTFVDAKASVIRASICGRIATIDLVSMGLELPVTSDPAEAMTGDAATSSPSSASSSAAMPAPAGTSSSSRVSGSSAGSSAVESAELAALRKPIVLVEPPHSAATAVVPAEGDIVLGRVLGVGDRQAEVEVLVLGTPGRALRSSVRGSVRKEDVRRTDVDRVVMLQAMRPGDVVRARVLSLGDRRSLFLSTAEAELGVIWAKSRAGCVMVPAAHDSMRCPVSGEDEPRKVARYGF